jgi:dipeptidyl aminopeptidase/acylaminoacyl peptidase
VRGGLTAIRRLGLRSAAIATLLLATGCNGELPGAAPVETACETNWRDMVLARAWAPTWSPDGREVAFRSSRSPEGVLSRGIYIADVHTRTTRKVYDDQDLTSIDALSWSPTGKSLLVSRGRWLYIFDLDSRIMRMLNAPDELMVGGAWTPDGDSIYYTREVGVWAENRLYVTSASGGIGRPFVSADGAQVYPAQGVDVGPGGVWLAFPQLAYNEDGSLRPGGEIFIVRSDGTGLRQLTNLRGFNGHPRWINGGTAILFDHLPEECYNTYFRPGHSWVVVPSTGFVYQLPNDVGDRRVQFGFPPAIDRTGTRAAAICLDEKTGYGAVWLMNVYGGNRRLLYSPRTVN